MYGKPADPEDARATLDRPGRPAPRGGQRDLPDRGAAGRAPPRRRRWSSSARSREPLIDWYVASGEWRERAGGYAIQGRGAALVAAIDGDYLNVVGLPVATLLELAPELLAA